MNLRVVFMTFLSLLTLGVFGQRHVGADSYQPFVRLPGNRPLIGVYFYGHRASPWKNNDTIFKKDLKQVRQLGANTLFTVHSPEQAYSDNWKAYDREHQAAKQTGLRILPGLDLRTGLNLSKPVVTEALGIDVPSGQTQDGEKQNSLIYTQEFREALFKYASEYLSRYLNDGALLRIMHEGKTKPVIALSYEVGWENASFDKRTNKEFQHFVYKHFSVELSSNIGELNFYWGTRLHDWANINTQNLEVFDLNFALPDDERLWRPLQYFAWFRAKLVDEALSEVKDALLEEYPDLLFASEIACPFGSEKRVAMEYRYRAACLPRVVSHADLVLVRTAGDVSVEEKDWLLKLMETGRQVVLCHRMAQDYGYGKDLAEIFYKQEIPGTSARFSNGIGFFSWNDVMSQKFVHSPDVRNKVRQIIQGYRAVYGQTEPSSPETLQNNKQPPPQEEKPELPKPPPPQEEKPEPPKPPLPKEERPEPPKQPQ